MGQFDPTIRAEVERIWREHLVVDPGATGVQLTAQFDEEAALGAGVAASRGGQGYLVRNWKAEHPGQDPDVMTTHQLQRIEAEIATKPQARDRWQTSMVEIPPSETVAPQPDQRFRCLASR
ncbi:hypothetical protein ACFTZB_32530 [Rhodococcus sp. NPDC057014]|uniref:hypothetical protein n=1 Tax=Rhodococcus sp. NPDC057014 TaxID=3346000 RepID=UPI0036382444